MQTKQGFWGPYTNMQSMLEGSVKTIVGAEGVYVYDADGKKYLDAHGGLWLVNVGYGRQEIIQAIGEQAQKLAWFPSFGGFANEPALALSERLVDLLAPEGMERIFFSNDGSGAVETALKISRQYWRLRGKPTKYKLIGRQYAYHGVTMGALSVAGLTANRAPFGPLVGGVRHAPAPYAAQCAFHPGSEECTFACARELERIIEFEGPDSVAAVIMEPVQAAGGVIIPPPDYLAQVRAICKKHEVLFIADEVVTGFGRLGSWFGSRHYGIQPDIMTMAKGLTSGYVPMGATAVSGEVFEPFVSTPTFGPEFRHGNTYAAHPIAAAAALANLDILEQEDVPANVRRMAPHFADPLQALKAEYPEKIWNVNAEGLIGRMAVTPSSVPGGRGQRVADLLYEHGVIVRPVGDIVTFSPPLTINQQEVEQMMTALAEVMRLLD